MVRRIKVNRTKKNVKYGKAWGYELWIHNDAQYCGKILHFFKDAKFSMHFHLIKNETWYVQSGKFKLIGIDADTADRYEEILEVGDIVYVERGLSHQLIALEEGDVFEISTQHFEEDSYRVEKGDSQK